MPDGSNDPKSKIDQLLTDLYDENAKTRTKAAGELGKLGDPVAIPDLAQVYQKDEDKAVRKAAGDALRIFRRMEQEMLLGDDLGDGKGGGSGTPLKGLRLLLIITLVLTVLANIGIYASKLLSTSGGGGGQVADQSTPTPRDALISTFKQRLTDARADAKTLRTTWGVLQGLQARWQIEECRDTDKKFNGVAEASFAAIDGRFYRDLPPVSEKLNSGINQINVLRDLFKSLCGLKDANELDAQVKNQGGAVSLVAKVDSASKDLDAAAGLLQIAIDKPAPTSTLTYTPTPPPTDTPTMTLTPSMTFTPSITPTSGPTTPPTATPVTPTATVPPPTTLTWNGLGLAALKTYRYKLTVAYNGVDGNNKPYTGGVELSVTHQDDPLAAQYEVSVSEIKASPYPQAIVKQLAGPFYFLGSSPTNSQYVISNGVLYVTGNASTNAICTAAQATAARLKGYAAVDEPDLKNYAGKLTLNLQDGAPQQVNGFNAQRYTGANSAGTETVEVSIDTATQRPVKVKYSLLTKATSGSSQLTTTLQYDLLAADQPVTINKQPICERVTPTK